MRERKLTGISRLSTMCLVLLSAVLVLTSGCTHRGRGTSPAMDWVEVAIELPESSAVAYPELKIVTDFETVAADTSGITSVVVDDVGQRGSVVLIDDEDRVIMISDLEPGCSSVRITDSTTALSIVMMDPVLDGIEEGQRWELAATIVSQDSFPQLVSSVRKAISIHGSGFLDSDDEQDLFRLAHTVAIGALDEFSEKVRRVGLGTNEPRTPYIEDTEGPAILLRNPRGIYYAVGAYNTLGCGGSAVTRDSLFVLGRRTYIVWPIHWGEATTLEYDLGDGEYKICFDKGGSVLDDGRWEWCSNLCCCNEVTLGTCCNVGQALWYILCDIFALPHFERVPGILGDIRKIEKLAEIVTDIARLEPLALAEDLAWLCKENPDLVIELVWGDPSKAPANAAQLIMYKASVLQKLLSVIDVPNQLGFVWELISAPTRVEYKISQVDGVLYHRQMFNWPSRSKLAARTGSDGGIELSWTMNSDADFMCYRLYRSIAPGVCPRNTLVHVATISTDTVYTDLDTVEQESYYYRLFVVNRSGNWSGSNEVRPKLGGCDYPYQVIISGEVYLDGLPRTRLTKRCGEVISGSLTCTVYNEPEHPDLVHTLVVGLRDSSGRWVGGDPEVVRMLVPDTCGTVLTDCSFDGIGLPAVSGNYTLWLDDIETDSESEATMAFMDAIVDSESLVNRRISQSGGIDVRVSCSNGLVAYYPFDGNANDHSGCGNHGIVHGATLTADRFGIAASAYDFDGVDDYIRVPDDPSLNFGEGDFSIVAFIYPRSIPKPGDQWAGIVIMDKRYTYDPGMHTPGYNQWQLKYRLGNKICLWTYSHEQSSEVCSPSDLEFSKWYHVAAVRHGTDLLLYIDGELVAQTTHPAVDVSTPMDMFIGVDGKHLLVDAAGKCFFDGIIDDIRIYRVALSAAQVDSLYHLGWWDPAG